MRNVEAATHTFLSQLMSYPFCVAKRAAPAKKVAKKAAPKKEEDDDDAASKDDDGVSVTSSQA